jgi:hypothetical protein
LEGEGHWGVPLKIRPGPWSLSLLPVHHKVLSLLCVTLPTPRHSAQVHGASHGGPNLRNREPKKKKKPCSSKLFCQVFWSEPQAWWDMPVILVLGRLRQENCELKASQGQIVSVSLSLSLSLSFSLCVRVYKCI